VRLLPVVAQEETAGARVRWINDVLDAASGTAEVLVEVEGADASSLRPGMTVVIEAVLRCPAGRLTIAKGALRSRAEGSDDAEVTVRRDGVETVRRVRLGFRGDDRVEIVDGLDAGDAVVIGAGGPADVPVPAVSR